MKFRFAVLLCVVLSASGLPAAAGSLSDIETFLGEKSFDEVQVSPDGSHLAFILRENDFKNDREVLTLWRIDFFAGGRTGSPVRLVETSRSSSLRWSPDGKLLSFLDISAPGSGAQLFTVDPSPAAKPKAITTADRFPDGVDLYDWLPDGSGFVVAASDPVSDSPDSKKPDGDVVRLPVPPIRSSFWKIPLGGDKGDGRAERLSASPFDELEALSVSPDGRSLAVIGNGSSETVESSEAALLPLAAGATSVRMTHNLILEDHVFWAGGDLFFSGMGESQNGRFVATEPRLYRADSSVSARELSLSRVAPAMEGSLGEIVPLGDGRMLIDQSISTHMRISLVDRNGNLRMLREQRGWVTNLSASRDGKRIAFVAGDPRHFAEIHVADGPAGAATARAVTDFNGVLSKYPLPEIETVSWDGGDGVTVEGVLHWPPGRKGERGLPMIVDLHGGPFGVARIEALDLYGSYTSYPALLAARGFLVLNVNYRGSGGRGDEFTRGIQDHFCSRPSEDVIRGVESLVARGWADPKRVGVIGYSGGGGLTKCLVGRTDIFRAIVTGAGVWDGISLSGTGRGRFWADVFFGGKAPWEDFQHWWDESPIGGIRNAKTPTLIVAGQRDGEAPAQAKEMYNNLLWQGTPAELLLFPGESHIFAKPSHKRTKIGSEVEWLEHYLLGKPTS